MSQDSPQPIMWLSIVLQYFITVYRQSTTFQVHNIYAQNYWHWKQWNCSPISQACYVTATW